MEVFLELAHYNLEIENAGGQLVCNGLCAPMSKKQRNYMQASFTMFLYNETHIQVTHRQAQRC